jgi:hypothetical protein
MTTEEALDALKSIGTVVSRWPTPLAAFVGALLELGADVLRAGTQAGEDPVRLLNTLRRDLRASVSAAWQAELDRSDAAKRGAD